MLVVVRPVVNPIPTATASNGGPICSGASLSLDETGGDAVSWLWISDGAATFDDNTLQSSDGAATFDDNTLQSPVASGAVDGEIFTVTITDVNGCTNTSTTTVSVNPIPTATASNGGPICSGASLQRWCRHVR